MTSARGLGAVAALAVVPLVGAAAGGVLRVVGCVPAPGAAGWVGLHLALTHPSAACPSGTVAVGGTPEAALAVVVTLALPALLAHAGAVLAAWGAIAAVRSLARTVGAIACRRRPVPAPAAGVPDVPAPPAPVVVVRTVRSRLLPRSVPRRGPPAVAIA
jgi:hypothetical protein